MCTTQCIITKLIHMCPLPEAALTASPTYNPVLKMDPGFVLIRYSKT